MMTTTQRLGVIALCAAMLSACGGGSDPAPTPADTAATVPDSATASVRAYTDFVSKLIADTQGSQQATPLLLTDNPAPLTETVSPLPVS